MNNLEKIRLAWSWGWSARIEFPDRQLQVVGIALGNQYALTYIALRCENRMEIHWLAEDDEILEKGGITGYLYAGQLAGSEPIPEGQKFRVKRTGAIGTFSKDLDCENCKGILSHIQGNRFPECFDKSEIEPYFE